VKIAGFGGQGVLSAGVLLANCAITAGLHATWLPSYGPEMRGGTANASVILSNEEIGSPLVDHPTALIAMNGPSLDAFEDSVEPGGLIVINSSIVGRDARRTDVRTFTIPASDIAEEIGFLGATNVVLLTAYAAIEGFPDVEIIREVIPHSLRKKRLIGMNLKMMDAALAYLDEHPVERDQR
jgi:2-oxoglutarate ferredoxin oxidoreductase subunit gamma